ncbi:MAG TPA: hypothetical protein ENJ95_07390 [Bacteroidetes bacterium]|nr:hypothetical protein [Bacteroidota bacterium]
MKKIFLFSLLSIFFISAFSTDAYSQRRHKKKKKSSKTDQYFDESGFANKLWYGGGFVLNFSGSGEVNQFAIGATPMVGYNVIGDIVSVGPRIGVIYTTIKGRGTDFGIHRVNLPSFTLGAFTRIKAFPNFFAQLEYEYETTKRYATANGLLFIENGEVFTAKETRDNVYVGVGYNSGGLWGYEIMLLYNLNEPENTLDLPISFRGGFTYKF